MRKLHGFSLVFAHVKNHRVVINKIHQSADNYIKKEGVPMLDEREKGVTIEEDLLSQILTLQAVINGLGEKGLLTKDEGIQQDK